MKAKHQITEKECKNKINGVCSRCGGGIEPIETVDNSSNPTFWPGCKSCGYFDSGVKEDVYKIAKSLVDDGVVHYQRVPHDPELSNYNRKEEIHITCRMVSAVLRRKCQ
jgi:hypothetical protein